jgi:hypothetical protein
MYTVCCIHQGLWGPGTQYPAFSSKDEGLNSDVDKDVGKDVGKDVDNADVAKQGGKNNKGKKRKQKQQAVDGNGNGGSDDKQRKAARDKKCFLQVMRAGGVSGAMCLLYESYQCC